jgi:hypothetical protein
MMCWKELAGITIEAYNGLTEEEKEHCAIYADHYAYAGLISFYGKEHGLPEPVSFSDNFLLWAPDSIDAETIIYVNKYIGDMEWAFGRYYEAGKIENEFFRENGVMVFVCSQPHDTFPDFYANKVKEHKSRLVKD